MTRAAILLEVAGFVIAAAVAAELLVVYPSSIVTRVIALAAVLLLLAWITLQDLRDFTIPDGAVAGLAVVGFASRLAAATAAGYSLQDVLVFAAFDAVLAGGAFWLLREAFFRRRGFDGLGFGDVKLAAAGAVLVGATLFAAALLIASLAGLAYAALRRTPEAAPVTAGGAADAQGPRIAFGAVLAPALAAAFVAVGAGLVAGPLPGG